MWLDKLKTASLLLLVVTIPFARLFNINSYAIALFTGVFLFSASKKVFRKSHLWLVLLIIYYFLICVNVLWIEQLESISSLTKYLPLFLIPIAVFFSEYKKVVLAVFVYSIALASLISLIYAYVKSKGYIFYFHNPTEIIDLQINYLGIFVSFSLAILYHEILQTNIAKLKHCLLVPFFFFVLAFLFNRTGIMASMAVTLVFLFIYFRKYRNLKFLSVFIVFFCLSIGYIFTRPITQHKFQEILSHDYQSASDYSNGISSRLLSWQCSLDGISKGNFFGYGLENSEAVLTDCYKGKLGENSVQFIDQYNAHNQFLQTTLDLGVLGLLILLSIYGCILYTGLKNDDSLLIFYFMIMLIFGITESFMIRQWGLVFFAVFTPYLLNKWSSTESVQKEK